MTSNSSTVTLMQGYHNWVYMPASYKGTMTGCSIAWVLKQQLTTETANHKKSKPSEVNCKKLLTYEQRFKLTLVVALFVPIRLLRGRRHHCRCLEASQKSPTGQSHWNCPVRCSPSTHRNSLAMPNNSSHQHWVWFYIIQALTSRLI